MPRCMLLHFPGIQPHGEGRLPLGRRRVAGIPQYRCRRVREITISAIGVNSRLPLCLHPNAPAICCNLASRTMWTDRFAQILSIRDQEIVEDDPVAPWQLLS